MSFVHYRWNDAADTNDSLFTGEPSRRSFDPSHGDQVLFLINCCAMQADWLGPGDVLQLESRIANHLPAEIKSERSVFTWMMQFLTKMG